MGAADGLWSFCGKTVVWQKNTAVPNESATWKECRKFRHCKNLLGIHWKVFWGLQKTLSQAQGRWGGRCKQFISAYCTVKDSAGLLQTHSWCLTSSGQSGRWLGEAALLWGTVASAAPDGLFSLLPLILLFWEYLGCIGKREMEQWGMKEKEGADAGME